MAWHAWLEHRERSIRREILAIYLAARDPRTPWYAKALAACVAAYALSPIDLIPDFIPVLGYLDDLVLVPLGFALAIRLIPPALLAEHRAEAVRRFSAGGPRGGRVIAVVIALAWVLAAAWLVRLVWPRNGQ
jgi:uncharacterized membrane protein YkvA (DUF1232 family)